MLLITALAILKLAADTCSASPAPQARVPEVLAVAAHSAQTTSAQFDAEAHARDAQKFIRPPFDRLHSWARRLPRSRQTIAVSFPRAAHAQTATLSDKRLQVWCKGFAPWIVKPRGAMPLFDQLISDS